VVGGALNCIGATPVGSLRIVRSRFACDASRMQPEHAPITLRDVAGGLEATIQPSAGMIITSLRHDGEELLGQRRGLEAYVRNGKTMGIPLLYPWANRVGADAFSVAGVAVDLTGERPGLRRDPHGLAIHGLLAADAGWELERAPSAEGGPPGELVATFDFGARPELLASFPFAHRVRYMVRLAAGALTIELTVTPTGDVAVPVAHGLHPYLAVPGADRADWLVTLPARRHLGLDERGLPTGDATTEPAWEGALATLAFDDAYDGLAPGAVFTVDGGGRRITTTFDVGYPAGQVFAPLEDEVICFEPMAAPTNALATGVGLRVVEPGAEDLCRVVIAVEPSGA